jgi:hypothetical protein
MPGTHFVLTASPSVCVSQFGARPWGASADLLHPSCIDGFGPSVRLPYKKVDMDLPKIPKAQPRPKGATEGLSAGQTIPSHY